MNPEIIMLERVTVRGLRTVALITSDVPAKVFTVPPLLIKPGGRLLVALHTGPALLG